MVSVAAACKGPAIYRSADGAVWNTTYHIVYQSDRDLRDSIVAAMKQVEASLSPFAGQSRVSRINRCETDTADAMLALIFRTSLRVNALSHGAFDPTVAPLVNLWGFGYEPGMPEPSQQAVDSLLLTVGLTECSLDTATMILRKKSPATQFNFSAITKGFGCDMVGAMLARNGCENYMVEIGGEIALRGVNPRGEMWRVMVDAPVESDEAPVHEELTTVSLSDCGMATSGNYRNFRETGQGRAWHTISPSTGRPAPTDLLSATVIAPTCMLADALATACMAMDSRSALEMIEATPEAEAILVTADTVINTGVGNRN